MLKKNGFTLLEILIGLSFMSGLVLVVAQLSKNASTSTINAISDSDVGNLKSEIKTILEAGCNENFANSNNLLQLALNMSAVSVVPPSADINLFSVSGSPASGYRPVSLKFRANQDYGRIKIKNIKLVMDNPIYTKTTYASQTTNNFSQFNVVVNYSKTINNVEKNLIFNSPLGIYFDVIDPGTGPEIKITKCSGGTNPPECNGPGKVLQYNQLNNNYSCIQNCVGSFDTCDAATLLKKYTITKDPGTNGLGCPFNNQEKIACQAATKQLFLCTCETGNFANVYVIRDNGNPSICGLTGIGSSSSAQQRYWKCSPF